MNKKIKFFILAFFCICKITVGAPVGQVATPLVSDTYITTENAKKKIFIQIGALESIENEKYNLRKVSDHLEFYLDDNVKIFQKRIADQNALRQWQFVVIKGPSNANSVLANSVYVFNDMESYNETKNDDKEDKKINVDSGIQGNVIKATSDSDEYEKLKEEHLKQQPVATPSASGEENTAVKSTRPFYIKTTDGNIYRVLHDEKTYWVFIEKKSKSDIKIGDRLKLYFDKRITVRYKSFPVKVVIENALGQY